MIHTNINKDISTHSFRHTHCALLIEAGVHIKEIQERLRHKNINTTMNIYAKITESYKKTPPKNLANLWKTSQKIYFKCPKSSAEPIGILFLNFYDQIMTI